MKPNFLSSCLTKYVLILVMSVATITGVRAQSFYYDAKEWSDTLKATQIKASGYRAMSAQHDKFYAMGTNWQNTYKYKSLQSFVKLYIDHSFKRRDTIAYTYKMVYELKGYKNPIDSNAAGSYDIINDTLMISYNPDSLTAYQDLQLRRYTGYHKIRIYNIAFYDVTSNPAGPLGSALTPSALQRNFSIEVSVLPQRIDKTNYNFTNTLTTSVGTVANNTLEINWQTSNGQENNPSMYELEWTYVDNYSVTPTTSGNSTVGTIPTNQLGYDFRGNSTRIRTDKRTYKIPLIYQQGYVVFRVRMIRPDTNDFIVPMYMQWSLSNETGLISSLTSGTHYYQITSPHMSDNMNWQYTVSFAEGGKYKHVMSYFDGLLKNRQTITRFNSSPNRLLATENIYDYEGRPAFTILPTPVTTPSFTYQPNLSLNEFSGAPYKAVDFDTIRTQLCPGEKPPARLASTALANQYYSSSNPDKSGFQKFVPDAGGYPFVQTIFAPGYQDRIERQGGAGDTLQIGYGHDTKFEYVDGDQMDLNRHFGADVGWSAFYNKIVKKDENGQTSFSVKDYKGRQVMTSVIGTGPDSTKHAIRPNEGIPDTSYWEQDVLMGTPQQIVGNKRIANKSFYMDVDGNDNVEYIYKFTPFPIANCPNKYLSVKAAYNYSIIDECGNQRYAESNVLGYTGVVSSATGTPYSSGGHGVALNKGKHILNKELTINLDDVDVAVDSFMKNPGACLRTEPNFIKESVQKASFPCTDTNIDPCSQKKRQMMDELYPGRKYGKYTLNNGVVVNGNTLTSIFDFYDDHYRFQERCLPIHMVTHRGFTDSLYRLSPQVLIQAFNDEIAEWLLPLHPEYCKLQACFPDDFKTQLLAIPDAKVAEKRNLLKLDSIIKVDPILSRLSGSPLSFVSPKDSLASFKGGKIRFDTLMTTVAYCGCTDTTMYRECVTNIYKSKINALTLDNQQVKETYFKNLVQVYIQNRERFKQMLTDLADSNCMPCKFSPTQRMHLVPSPVFPKNYRNNQGGIDTTSLSSFWKLFNNTNNPSVDSIVRIMKDMMNNPPDSLKKYADSANINYASSNSALCTGQVDSIMARLGNCFGTNTTQYNNVKTSLLNLCQSGAVQLGNYTPKQIRDALISNGVSLNDFCNPYLINYDPFPLGDKTTTTGLACQDDQYYFEQRTFLNKQPVLDAFTNPTVVKSLSLSVTTSSFEKDISAKLNNSTSISALAIYVSSEKLYKLKLYSATATDTVIIYLRGSGSGSTSICNNIFGSPGTDVFSFIDVKCIKESGSEIGPGYIGNYAFTAVIQRIAGSQTYGCSMLGWTNNIPMSTYTESKLTTCIPCTQMRSLYKEFSDTLAVYGVKGTDHPYYPMMLKVFMNQKIGKAFTASQYQRFIESCALADSTYMKQYVGYSNISFTDSTSAAVFLNAINNIDSNVSFVYPYTENNTKLVLDFNQVPKSKLWLYRNFITAYTSGVTAKNINQLLQSSQSASRLGFIYMPANAGIMPNWSSILGTNASNFSFGTASSANIRISNINTACSLYTIDIQSGAKPYNVSEAVYKLYRYIYDNGLPIMFVSNYQHTVDEDYFLAEKKAFLNYVYQMQGFSASNVLDTLQEKYLNQLVAYQTKPVTYSILSKPGNTEHLYITDPSNAAQSRFAKLRYMFHTIRTNFTNQLFFSSPKQLINTDSSIVAFRCSDGSYMYRYFGAGDTLYNAFLRMPAYMTKSEHQAYKLLDTAFVKPAPGDSTSRNFSIKLIRTAPADTITVNGMTDYVIAKNVTLENVLLGNPVTETIAAPDTFEHCERQRLRDAINDGKFRYAVYIDSISKSLRAKFRAHVMNNLNEVLKIGYVDQRFQTTLYYYDRAGNLIQTVPPEGVRKLNATATSKIDSARIKDTTFAGIRVNHQKKSIYYYNTMNQLVKQMTPDGGTTDFYYDAAGRLVFSQNSKQRTDGNFTYTLYDNQSRVVETGQAQLGCTYFSPTAYTVLKPGNILDTLGPPQTCAYIDLANNQYTPVPPQIFNLQDFAHDSIARYIRKNSRQDVVFTVYDTVAMDLSTIAGMSKQQNLRKRVSTVKFFENLSPIDKAFKNYSHASYYSYDALGNVQTLMHDFPQLSFMNQQYKRIDYDYDLISGKVNLLSYNRGFADQYYQRYGYDDDNRIKLVETSPDGIVWKRDAEYDYYQHGPLARLSLGDLRVQGVDYAYTVQGWLKAINGDILAPDKDMGKDAGGGTSIHANDAIALTLEYYKNDYKPIGLSTQAVTNLTPNSQSLYNGNIAGTKTAIAPLPSLSTIYTYDQLNRIKTAVYESVNPINNTLTGISDYKSNYWYDQDGNIKRLTRRGNSPGNTIGGTTQAMDIMSYFYMDPTNNKLKNVTDSASHTYTKIEDIATYTNNTATRYLYDPIGNVIKDLVSGEDTVKWNLYNKVTETSDGTAKRSLKFMYDAMGNRVFKSYLQNDTANVENNEYYVRDAQGNILAVYKRETAYKWVKTKMVAATFGDIIRQGYTTPFINDVLVPYYSADGNFAATFNDGAGRNYAEWVGGQITSATIPALLEQNGLMTRLLQGTTDYLSPLYTYTKTATDAVIGDSWQQMYDRGDVEAVQQWTTALFNNPSKPARKQVLQLLCAADGSNTMLDQLAADYYHAELTGTTCADKASDLADIVYTTTGDYSNLANGLMALRASNSTDFDNFLHSLAVDDVTMTNSYYMGSSGTLAPNVQNELVNFGSHEQLGTFFANWASTPAQMQVVADATELSSGLYASNPGSYLAGFVSATADTSVIAEAIASIPGFEYADFAAKIVNINGYYPNTNVEEYKGVKQTLYDRYYLAEHHLYGSSRLGIKQYWPTQIGIKWNFTNTGSTIDSSKMGIQAQLPWYSLEYQDLIKSKDSLSLAGVQTAVSGMQHMLGTKQYELTNHLGNVMATLSDKRKGIKVGGGNDSIVSYRHALPAVYDYYPFGMLMPGRYMSDTSSQCVWITQTTFAPMWVDEEYIQVFNAPKGWVGKGAAGLMIAGQGTENPVLEVTTSTTNEGMENTSYDGVPGQTHEVTAEISYLQGSWDMVVEEYKDDNWQQLASVAVDAATSYTLSFVPSVTSVRYSFMNKTGSGIPTKLNLKTYHLKRLEYRQQNTVTQVCNGSADKYRFGFNGQMKDNEIAGIGNRIDFHFRGYDSRLGRFLSVDPLSKQYPWNSNYAFAENRVIDGLDIEGLEYLGSNVSRIEFKYGRLQLKVSNLHNYNQINWRIANEDPANWPSGSIGLNPTIANIDIANPFKKTEMADMPDKPKNSTEVKRYESSPDNRAARRNQERNGPKIVGNSKEYKAPIAAFGKASIYIDAIVLGLDKSVEWVGKDDREKIILHTEIANKVAIDVSRALNNGTIPEKYQNKESIINIMNVVLQGKNNTNDPEIYNIGMKIYNDSNPKNSDFVPSGLDNFPGRSIPVQRQSKKDN